MGGNGARAGPGSSTQPGWCNGPRVGSGTVTGGSSRAGGEGLLLYALLGREAWGDTCPLDLCTGWGQMWAVHGRLKSPRHAALPSEAPYCHGEVPPAHPASAGAWAVAELSLLPGKQSRKHLAMVALGCCREGSRAGSPESATGSLHPLLPPHGLCLGFVPLGWGGGGHHLSPPPKK